MANRRKNPRSLEAMQLSGFANLFGEASQLVPVSYAALRRYREDNRLRTFGSPEKVEIDHLLEQARKDYPKVR